MIRSASAVAASAPLWDAHALARIRQLHLRARVLTDALLMGEHRSRRVGQAVEFADYQEYQPGMDIRGLDWRVWGRSDRYVVRRFETETELPCSVVLDLSGDMGTGRASTHGIPGWEGTKAAYAVVLAATLLYFLHRHGEPVGLEIVAGRDMAHSSFATRGGKNHLQAMFHALAVAQPAGVADLVPALARVGGRTRRRSWVAVISDGMEEPAHWLPSLSALARRGVDFRFLHVHDPAEWSLEFRRSAQFFSPEGGDALAVDPGPARAAFRSVVEEYVAEVQSGVTRWGGRYLAAPTNGSMESLLRAAIQGVAPRGGR